MTGAGLTEEKLFGDVLASATMGEASVAQEKTTNRRPKEGLKIWCQSRAVNTTLQAPLAQKSIHMSLVLWILIWVFILFILFILFHTISRHITCLSSFHTFRSKLCFIGLLPLEVHIYRQSVNMGPTSMSEIEVNKIIEAPECVSCCLAMLNNGCHLVVNAWTHFS